MTAPALFVERRSSVSAAEALLRCHAADWLLVMDDDMLLRVVSSAELSVADAEAPLDSLGTESFFFACAHDALGGVIEGMLQRGLACVPVLDEQDSIAGILTRAELRRARLLPGERGMDLCGSCGSDEHLEQPCSERGRAFCVECLAPTGFDAGYATLGGSG
ncbi:MAG: CBS domain-containing protein [Polyangiaceae bacterium]|nr:CBS domain-containing protein [Polyangiaceae bacterium]MCL4752645.1 CBS domain-containing protein [Myxococcales bacterium]